MDIFKVKFILEYLHKVGKFGCVGYLYTISNVLTVSTPCSGYLRNIGGMLMCKRHLFTLLNRWPSLSSSHGRQIKSTIRSHWMRMRISGLFIWQFLTIDFSHLPSRHWTLSLSVPSNTKLTDQDTRKHFRAFLTHTSHPRAGWENRCQQSTTHTAGKEPDRISNEQQAAHQPLTTARFTWYLQYSVLHVAVAHRETLVSKCTRLCEAPFISVEWLFHCEASRRVSQLKGCPVSIYVQWPAARHFSLGLHSTPFALQAALFSHEKCLQTVFFFFFW